MADLDEVILKLAATSVEDKETDVVSFKGKGLKLDTEEDAAEIVRTISNCSNMTTLCLEGNTIGVPAAKAIGKALESQGNFKKAFWKDMFTQRTENEIPDALNELSLGIKLANAQLTVLDLSDNAFGPRGMKGIVELLKSSSCYTLEELYLNNNGLGPSGADMLAQALLECLTNSREAGSPLTLKVFVCGRNRLENEGCTAISAVLKEIGTLEQIILPQNGIYHEGVKSLSESLVGNNVLKVLNLEDNCFTKEGAEEIAKALPSFENVEIINFGDCLTRSEGAECIAEALKESCLKLKELNLGYNEMNLNSGKAIVSAMANKQDLEKLILNGNTFGEKGCKLIQQMMEDMGMTFQLESLDDDEGSDNSEDDNKELNEDDDDKVDATVGDSWHNPKSIASMEFLGNPSADKLINLYELKVNLLEQFPGNLTPAECFDLFLMAASIVATEAEKTKEAAFYFTDNVLSSAFTNYSEAEMWRFNSDFLAYLGLVKCEDHDVRNVKNFHGIFLLLSHAVKQSYFHDSTKELLKFFLSKSNKWKNIDSEAKTLLLNSLNEAA